MGGLYVWPSDTGPQQHEHDHLLVFFRPVYRRPRQPADWRGSASLKNAGSSRDRGGLGLLLAVLIVVDHLPERQRTTVLRMPRSWEGLRLTLFGAAWLIVLIVSFHLLGPYAFGQVVIAWMLYQLLWPKQTKW